MCLVIFKYLSFKREEPTLREGILPFFYLEESLMACTNSSTEFTIR